VATAASPPTATTKDPCTTDFCTAGKCAVANNTLACDDKDACTAGKFAGTALACDDKKPVRDRRRLQGGRVRGGDSHRVRRQEPVHQRRLRQGDGQVHGHREHGRVQRRQCVQGRRRVRGQRVQTGRGEVLRRQQRLQFVVGRFCAAAVGKNPL
jgi:hypothetical protein